MAHLTSISAGRVPLWANLPCGVLKTKSTATPHERPPDRQTNKLITATTRKAFTETPRILKPQPNAAQTSDNQNQTVREPLDRTNVVRNDPTHAGGRAPEHEPSLTANAVHLNMPTNSRTHGHADAPQSHVQTNRSQNKPLCASSSQSKRTQASTNNPSEALSNTGATAAPPPPCIAFNISQTHDHADAPQSHVKTNHSQNKPLCALSLQSKRTQALTDKFSETHSDTGDTAVPPPNMSRSIFHQSSTTPPRQRVMCKQTSHKTNRCVPPRFRTNARKSQQTSPAKRFLSQVAQQFPSHHISRLTFHQLKTTPPPHRVMRKQTTHKTNRCMPQHRHNQPFTRMS